MINNTKILWVVVAIVAVISIVAFFNGKTITQVIQNPLGSMTSPWTVGPEFSINELNTYVARADFKNATTTFVSFISPMPATSTIDLVELIQTGLATSTIKIHCGVSNSAYGVPVTDILTSGTIATSTYFWTMVNNEANSFPVSGGSTARARIGPKEYFLCAATDNQNYKYIGKGGNEQDGVAGDSNTFGGNFKVRFTR
jgi:hypothetical protein